MNPHERLAQELNKRRLELGLHWVDITSAARITDSALRAIRRGDYPPSELTARKLEDAVHWLPGSVNAILDSGEPTGLEQTAASVRASGGPSLEQIDTLLQQFRAEREQPGADVEDIDYWIGLLEHGRAERLRRKTG